ncbi:MAG: PEP/pyruvate-binding domain-containing protein, partial [Candidatus Cloacimonetes bacterium]|nr:PEP/pyruvate-binding domain-containing protein [Candidatus Cloacimonadota bacterium]
MRNMESGKQYNRIRNQENDSFIYLGSGMPGGKASGLSRIKSVIDANFTGNNFGGIKVDIPHMLVILTDVFDDFMKTNDLYPIALSGKNDTDIALAFQAASFPPLIIGDLLSFINNQKLPLAVRSSSLLEDALYEPFAGVYETKMIPNNQPDSKTRFTKLIEAIKFVYASTFFHSSKDYFRATGKNIRDEKMAVIIQEIIGYSHNNLYYPTVSGVARSYNFYPSSHSKPEEGIVNLALGLGKTIVDGSTCWSYSPAYPTAPPPYNSISELLKTTQTEFWAVTLEKPFLYDPVNEVEYLVKENLERAETDGTLAETCSTYNGQSDRLYPGIFGDGPRLLNFAALLKGIDFEFNDLIKKLLEICEDNYKTDVEIEFAMATDSTSGKSPVFGFLQVRPMVVSGEFVDISEDEITPHNCLLYSEKVMGNGLINDIEDVIFVKPETFDKKQTNQMAVEIAELNELMLSLNKKYLLIGFGRWGTSDNWAGIPVKWGQISEAKVIVESALPDINQEMSQGSHFFHNMTSFKVLYFSTTETSNLQIDWDWLNEQDCVTERNYVKHVRLKQKLLIKVDGRHGKGLINK